jgi:hypothetical protein
MLLLAVPPLKVRNVCAWLDGNVEVVRIATSPVGVPEPEAGATDVVTLIGVPCVIFVEERPSVVVVGRKLMEFQLFTSALASTDPRPLA